MLRSRFGAASCASGAAFPFLGGGDEGLGRDAASVWDVGHLPIGVGLVPIRILTWSWMFLSRAGVLGIAAGIKLW